MRRTQISAVLAVSIVLAMTASASSYAEGLVRDPLVTEEAVLRGPTGMLTLRIPFGGDSQNPPAPRLTLGFGTSWQNAPASATFASYRFVPSAEAGFTLTGDPVLRLGPIDLLRELRATANEGASATTGGGTPTWVWWALGGAAVLGVTWAILASQGTSACHPIYGPLTDDCFVPPE
jgi:hypothetical protein